MRQKHLRILRIIISVFFLVFMSALFVDYREFIPVSYAKWVLYPQLIPSVISFITLPAALATGFLLILILTFLFGRVYCSAICPLGALQDVYAFLSKKFRIIKRYKFKKALDYLRYPFLGLTVVFLLFGSMLVLNLLDPYSSFGRIFSDLARPGVVTVNNLLAAQLEKMEVYFLFRVDMGLFTWQTIFIPIFTAVLIIWLSVYFGRLYCNTVCPVGTTLGLLSRLSLFRIKMDRLSCTRCGKCAFVCKSNCIDIKNFKVDFSRCVACYNCITACEYNAIKYEPAYARKPVNAELSADRSKRNFIGKSLLLGMALTGLKQKSTAQDHDNLPPGDIPNNRQHPVSPPGSVSLKHFTDRCTACHLCVTSCPTGVLQPSFLEYGISGIMQPHMDYSVEYCNYECTICSQVCPTGAIMPLTVDDKKLTQTGVVHLILDKCIVVTDNTACGSCSEHCPTQAVRMVPFQNGLTIPELNETVCIGCGACEYACPVRPYTAIYVEGNPIHQVAEQPQTESLEYREHEDFPF
ncbi:MAG: 4Fe-4S binding protein [Bacteroidales bacterium]|nr:4Fe-4S binding protein [Bacteroidales bacterium]